MDKQHLKVATNIQEHGAFPFTANSAQMKSQPGKADHDVTKMSIFGRLPPITHPELHIMKFTFEHHIWGEKKNTYFASHMQVFGFFLRHP